MPSTPNFQSNPYKGARPRCWIRIRLVGLDGSTYERDMLADSGSPCAVILGADDLNLLSHGTAARANTNFGRMAGGWLRLAMPEFALTDLVRGFGSNEVLKAVQTDCPDFCGLVGLPLLRMLEYGGNRTSFWIRELV